jgi:hypothetical protein
MRMPGSRHSSLTSAVIGSLADKFIRRKEQKIAELRRVNDVARELRLHARHSLEQSFSEMEMTIADVGYGVIRARGRIGSPQWALV